MKVVGLTRLFDFPDVQITLDALGDLVDEIYIFVDRNVNKKVLSIASSHPKVVEIEHNEQAWHQARSLQKAFNMLEKVKPDFVFYPDEDELFPKDRDLMLKWLSTDERASLSFHLLVSWGDINSVAVGAGYTSRGPHVKALRWHPEIIYIAPRRKYRCLCRPWNCVEVVSPLPMRHLAVYTENLRNKRKRRHARVWQPRTEPMIMPFEEDKCFESYLIDYARKINKARIDEKQHRKSRKSKKH